MDYRILQPTLSRMARFRLVLIVALTAAVGCSSPADGPRPVGEQTSFSISIDEAAFTAVADLGLETPVTGRAFVIVSREDETEPRLQTGVSGVPFWGRDVASLQPGDPFVVAAGAPDVRGYPFPDLAELPAGEYYVQALLNVYTRFDRADGHSLYMHLNSGAGQNKWRAPGNVHSQVKRISLPTKDPISLTLDSVIPPTHPLGDNDVLQQGNPPDTPWVKYVKIRSDKLSEFWGRDMYIGANVLLPADYESDTNRQYPVVYMQGHFPGARAPLGFVPGSEGRGRGAGFAEFWASGEAPKMIAVSIRDANPYYDTSYSVNSENVGPYGDAITEELIPYLEAEFRMIASASARVVAGGSTGGWEALAMQIYYPDDFGGAWGWCPDPVDFNYYQIVNIYEDENAYFAGNDWHLVERPNARRFDGNVRSTVRQENHMEYAAGPNSRSGGQWAIWEAVFGPVGDDGFPAPIWDPISGDIDRATANYWRENFDLHHHLRTNWETLSAKLDGKLHVAVGDMDSYYLDNAVYLLDEFLGSEARPAIDYDVEYGRRKPHCWTGYSPSGSGEDITNIEFVQVVAGHFADNGAL